MKRLKSFWFFTAGDEWEFAPNELAVIRKFITSIFSENPYISKYLMTATDGSSLTFVKLPKKQDARALMREILTQCQKHFVGKSTTDGIPLLNFKLKFPKLLVTSNLPDFEQLKIELEKICQHTSHVRYTFP